MTNFEAFSRFEKLHCAHIVKMHWIAGSLENSDFEKFLQDIEEEDFLALFPDNENIDYDDWSSEGLAGLFIDFKMYGLIAEVHIPECTNFRFKDGKPEGWCVRKGICLIRYCYGETLEDLMVSIEKSVEEEFQACIKRNKS